jgi:hypothetical protein
MTRYPRFLLACAVALICTPGTPRVGATQSVLYYRFTPIIVPQSSIAPVTLEVKTANSPSSVALALASTPGSPVPLVDDGSGADAVGGDGIFSVALSASDVLYDFAADDVNRNFVGYLRLYQNTTQVLQVNIFVDVITPDIPSVVIRGVSARVQYSDHLVNIVDPTFFPLQGLPLVFPTMQSAKTVAQVFYGHFPDVYDFLNIISEIPYPGAPGISRNAGHGIIQSNAANIGPGPQAGGPADWGSTGRLLGETQFPTPTFFDGASSKYLHELAHQWINFVDVSPLNLGRGGHWPLSDLASDIMGYAVAANPQGLRFDFDLVPSGSDYRLVPNHNPKVYSDLGLYLMGLAAPSEVGDHFVFDDQNQPVSSLLHGPVTIVSMPALISAMGLRAPVYAAAPSRFRVATILVSRDGLVSADAMRLYDHFSARAEGLNAVPTHEGFLKEMANPFAAATRGRGHLDHRVMHRVLVDASRDGGLWWAPQSGPFDPANAHQGKLLADYLRAHGYLVDELPRASTVTSVLLQPYDIVMRAGAVGAYAPAEIAAYQGYVQGGGRLLLLADHMANAPADGVAESFGIQFGGVTRGVNQMTRYLPHPITAGVGVLPYQVGSAVLKSPALARLVGSLSTTSFLDLNNNGTRDPAEPQGPNVLGVMSSGKGRIAFCGDVGLWESVPQPLVSNVFAWLEDS